MKIIVEKEETIIDGEGSEFLKVGNTPTFIIGGSHKSIVKNIHGAVFSTERELLIYRVNLSKIPKWKKWLIRNVL